MRTFQRRAAAFTLMAIVMALTAPIASAGLLVTARDDAYTALHDRVLTVSAAAGVLNNDSGIGMTAAKRTNPTHGTVTVNTNGSFTYRPDAGYVGADSFTYDARVLNLGVLVTDTATVDLTVTNPNAPTAANDAYSATTGVRLSVPAAGVLANDSDADGDALTAVLVDGGGNGSLDLNSNGSFTFTSGGSFTGTRTFTYRAFDGDASSPTRTVTITVTAPAPTPTPVPTPTPAPTPSPTPAPTPKPSTPTPTPTPAPTSTATPRPTPTPTPRPTSLPSLPSLPPVPTLPPVRTLPPIVSPSPVATPTRTPTTTPTPRPTADPAAASTGTPTVRPTAPGAGGGPVAPSSGGSGGGAATQPPTIDEGPFTINGPDRGGTVELDTSSITLAGFEWAVPALVLTVPGLLLLIAVAVETMIGLAWLPVARRWVGRDEHTNRRRRRLNPS